ncbi:hypothetical protein, partial [Aeromonas veronii]|uniref:hypothetical protein n=1 Tax=Aeromonas veronii TaxID=654 RepID=UPI003D245B7B
VLNIAPRLPLKLRGAKCLDLQGANLPKSTTRLQKMANSLASFARNAQRSPHDTSVAVKEWKEDLDYLYHTFYQQWHRFPWPDIET